MPTIFPASVQERPNKPLRITNFLEPTIADAQKSIDTARYEVRLQLTRRLTAVEQSRMNELRPDWRLDSDDDTVLVVPAILEDLQADPAAWQRDVAMIQEAGMKRWQANQDELARLKDLAQKVNAALG